MNAEPPAAAPRAPELGPTNTRIVEWRVGARIPLGTYVAGFVGALSDQPEWVANFVCEDGTRGFAGARSDGKGWGFAYWSPPERSKAVER